MPYTLLNDGDGFEQHYWPLFSSIFPSYERYWELRVVPLTNRPTDIHFKSHVILTGLGIDPEEVCKAQLHYTIFRHLARSHVILEHLINKTQNIQDTDTLAEGLFHVVAAQDVAFEFLQRMTTPGVYDPWLPRRARGAGNPPGSKEATDEWKRNNGHPLSDIRDYRNHLSHGRMSPSRQAGNKMELPKIGMEIKYLDWRTVTDQYNSLTVVASEFDILENILSGAWDATINYMETEWQRVI